MARSFTRTSSDLFWSFIGFAIFSFAFPLVVVHEFYEFTHSFFCRLFPNHHRANTISHIVIATISIVIYLAAFVAADKMTAGASGPAAVAQHKSEFQFTIDQTWLSIALGFYHAFTAILSCTIHTVYKLASIYILLLTKSPILCGIWFLSSVWVWVNA